jgi:hypothetical protein
MSNFSFNPSLELAHLVDERTQEINYKYREGIPRSYRFNASNGVVTFNGELPVSKKGEDFSFIPIACRIFEAELFDYSNRLWAELFFLNQAGHVCCILFHGYTVDELQQLESDLYYSDLTITQVILTLKPIEKTSKETGNKFYIGTFDFKPAPADYVDVVSTLLKETPLYRQDTRKDLQNNILSVNYALLPEIHTDVQDALSEVAQTAKTPTMVERRAEQAANQLPQATANNTPNEQPAQVPQQTSPDPAVAEAAPALSPADALAKLATGHGN